MDKDFPSFPCSAMGIREKSRLSRSSSSSSSAPHEAYAETSMFPDAVHMTESCVQRMKELQATEENPSGKVLRLSVETGGCSGFQYIFYLGESANSDGRIFEKDGVKLVVDSISYDFVKGAAVDYVKELIRSAFQVPDVLLN